MKRTLAPILGTTLLVSGASLYAAYGAGEVFTDQEPSATESESASASAGGEDVIGAMFKKLEANQDGTIDKTKQKNDAALSNSFKTITRKGKLVKNGYHQWEQSRNARQTPKG